MIELRLIGCNGGIGGTGRHTTCYGIGERIVIDAGTGLGTLPLEQLARIDHVVLTHAHLDHVACLPLMMDSVAALRDKPVTVWAQADIIGLLRAHLFNDQIWPDFTQIPTPEQAFLRFEPMPDHGAEIDGFRFTPLPASHGIPACGYRVEAGDSVIAFSGDTGDCAAFWELLAGDAKLKAVVIECSYPAAMKGMAELSMHMHSEAVATRLRELPPQVAGVIVHRKPGLEADIARELSALLPGRDVRLPEPGDVYRIG
jgi:3',5'-cyclic-nucleotide phosphodiesterase